MNSLYFYYRVAGVFYYFTTILFCGFRNITNLTKMLNFFASLYRKLGLVVVYVTVVR